MKHFFSDEFLRVKFNINSLRKINYFKLRRRDVYLLRYEVQVSELVTWNKLIFLHTVYNFALDLEIIIRRAFVIELILNEVKPLVGEITNQLQIGWNIPSPKVHWTEKVSKIRIMWIFFSFSIIALGVILM